VPLSQSSIIWYQLKGGDAQRLERQPQVWRRDVVLEASASARGGLEAVFLAGSASPRPHTVLPRSWLGPLGLEGSALPRLGSISKLKRASAHGAQVQVQRYAQRLCLLLEMNNEECLNVCF